MNEEWWGICAKGPPDSRGLFELYPRAAYYALQRAFTLAPYAPATDLAAIRAHFAGITPDETALRGARRRRPPWPTQTPRSVRVSGLRLEFETFSTGGARISTPADDARAPAGAARPSAASTTCSRSTSTSQAQPASNVTGTLSLNVLGNVPDQPDRRDLLREPRSAPAPCEAAGGTVDAERHRAGQGLPRRVSWDDRWFRLDGFYRTGHYPLGLRGRLLRPLPRGQLRPEHRHLQRRGADRRRDRPASARSRGLKVAFGPAALVGRQPRRARQVRPPARPLRRRPAMYQEDIAAASPR